MKNRRGFLKLLGLGAGAAAGAVLATVAGRDGTPTIPPRTPEDVERGPKPYIGPDGVPNGDFIRRKPDLIREIVPIPPALTPEQHQWIVDGQKVVTFVPAPPPLYFGKGDIDISGWNDMKPGDLVPVVQIPEGSNSFTTGGAPYKTTTTSDGTS
jgi:hypothetical protein